MLMHGHRRMIHGMTQNYGTGDGQLGENAGYDRAAVQETDDGSYLPPELDVGGDQIDTADDTTVDPYKNAPPADYPREDRQVVEQEPGDDQDAVEGGELILESGMPSVPGVFDGSPATEPPEAGPNVDPGDTPPESEQAEVPHLSEATEVPQPSETPDGEPPPEGNGAYDPVVAAREDRVVIAEAVRVITNALETLLRTLDHERSTEEARAAEQVMAGTGQILRMTDDMLAKGPAQDPDLAFAATAQAEAVKGETKPARKRWRKPAWDTVWNEVKMILRRLWSMIGHLVQVKEWTVQGQVSTPLFGLGSASVSVTFGKP